MSKLQKGISRGERERGTYKAPVQGLALPAGPLAGGLGKSGPVCARSALRAKPEPWPPLSGAGACALRQERCGSSRTGRERLSRLCRSKVSRCGTSPRLAVEDHTATSPATGTGAFAPDLPHNCCVAFPTVVSEVERTPGYLQCTVHCSRAWATVHMLVLASHWRSTLPMAFPHLSHRRWGGLNRRCILSHNPGRHRA